MSPASTYTFEPLFEHQARELFAVYQKLFPPFGWSAPYLRWQYYENPAGAAKVWVARHDGEIVASYTAIPHEMYVDRRLAIGWRVQNVVTLPEYRRQGLYHELASVAAQELFKSAHPLNFAFPNERSKNGFVRMGWKAAFRLPLKTMTLRHSKPSARVAATVTPLRGFDADSESVWKAHRDGVGFAIERSASYLTWRYLANPKSEYASFRLDSGHNAAIMILKVYARDDGSRVCHLCDLFQSEPDASLTESALGQWIEVSAGRDCQAMSCWCGIGSGLKPLLDRAGFMDSDGFDRWMLLNANAPPPETATVFRYDDERSWHLVMGDSDVY